MTHAAASEHLLPDLADQPPLLTIRAVAELLSVHDRTVRRWITEDRLKTVRAGGAIRITRSEVCRFLEAE